MAMILAACLWVAWPDSAPGGHGTAAAEAAGAEPVSLQGEVSPPGRARAPIVVAAAATEAAATSQPATAPAPDEPSQSLEDLLRLDPKEQALYRAVFGRKTQLDEDAFTIFLQRISRLPTLSREQIDALDRPTTRSLLEHPDVYAGQPIQLAVYIMRTAKWTPGPNFAPTRWWTRDQGPVWMMACENAASPKPVEDPLYVVTTQDPQSLLGRPYRVDADGSCEYRPNQRFTLAGVFYKVYNTQDTNPEHPATRDYPVVLAWQISLAAPTTGPAPVGPMGVVMGMVFVGLAVTYVMLRRHVKRVKTATDAANRRRRRPWDQLEDAPVDEDLQAAAEQFRQLLEKEKDPK